MYVQGNTYKHQKNTKKICVLLYPATDIRQLLVHFLPKIDSKRDKPFLTFPLVIQDFPVSISVLGNPKLSHVFNDKGLQTYIKTD